MREHSLMSVECPVGFQRDGVQIAFGPAQLNVVAQDKRAAARFHYGRPPWWRTQLASKSSRDFPSSESQISCT